MAQLLGDCDKLLRIVSIGIEWGAGMNKLELLKQFIGSYNTALIAFSGGVDSTFLAKVAAGVLEKHILLITATSCTYPASELEDAKRLAKQLNVRHEVIVSEELNIPGFAQNTPDRCYHCKHELFSRLTERAQRDGIAAVFEGSTMDDLNDYRPGRRAVRELGIVSPLVEVQLTKDEIRAYSAELNLETATKPSYACLASRFPYGEEITRKKLLRVGTAEEVLKTLGLRQFRVRSHDDVARVEVAPQEMDHAWKLHADIDTACRQSGFTYVALDLKGYRTGAMNEALNLQEKSNESVK